MIPLIKSTFYDEKNTKKKLAAFIKNANRLSFGRECEMFEKGFARHQGRKYCVFVNSGSSANLALTQSLLNLDRIQKGDMVGISSLTWSTNAMPLIQLGLNTVPIDIELDTLNVSSKKLLNSLKKYHLKALFLTNLLDFCDDIDEIKRICREKKIIFVEDNCEALGTVYKGRNLGNYGEASTFSFYVGHHMSTIEGGAICTYDNTLANMLRIVRAHGWDRNLDFVGQNKIREKFKINSAFYSRYTFYDLGFNLRPTEISGFIGKIQLKYLDKIIQKRRDNFLKLAKKIYSREDLFYPIRYNHIDFVSNFAIPVVCRSKKIRDMLVKKCEDKIELRPIVAGDITSQPFFLKYMRRFYMKNINASLVRENGFYLGNNPELNKRDLDTIIETIIGKI